MRQFMGQQRRPFPGARPELAGTEHNIPSHCEGSGPQQGGTSSGFGIGVDPYLRKIQPRPVLRDVFDGTGRRPRACRLLNLNGQTFCLAFILEFAPGIWNRSCANSRSDLASPFASGDALPLSCSNLPT